MASFALLPNELLLAILNEAVHLRSVKRALRLRLVCKRFANIATIAIFSSDILDGCGEVLCNAYQGSNFWAEYLAYRTLTHVRRKTRALKRLFLIAQHICRSRYALENELCDTTGAIGDDEMRECVLELCKLLTCSTSFNFNWWLVATSANSSDREVDESSINFRRHLLSAAAWMGEQNLVVKLVEEGCNFFSFPGGFLEPIRAASFRGHVDIVKILLVDDSVETIGLSTRLAFIVNFATPNGHNNLFDLTLDPSWHTDQVRQHDIDYLCRLALNITCSSELFIRLIEGVKPRIDLYKSKWLQTRIRNAALDGQVDIVRFLIQKEGADVNGTTYEDDSLFQSRHPAEFVKRWGLQSRGYALVSHAAKAGHVGIVKFLLDAGAKHDHAIEFAAMCGSRALVRLLWEHGENKDDAVQGALAVAVDQEDTAMFNLLEELGAKLDDDVRAAAIEKAQEEGLDSMVRLLSKDANASF